MYLANCDGVQIIYRPRSGKRKSHSLVVGHNDSMGKAQVQCPTLQKIGGREEEEERKARKKGGRGVEKENSRSCGGNQALGKLTFKAPCYFSKSQRVLAP